MTMNATGWEIFLVGVLFGAGFTIGSIIAKQITDLLIALGEVLGIEANKKQD